MSAGVIECVRYIFSFFIYVKFRFVIDFHFVWWWWWLKLKDTDEVLVWWCMACGMRHVIYIWFFLCSHRTYATIYDSSAWYASRRFLYVYVLARFVCLFAVSWRCSVFWLRPSKCERRFMVIHNSLCAYSFDWRLSWDAKQIFAHFADGG